MGSRVNGIKKVHRSSTGEVDSWTEICDDVKTSTTNLEAAEIINELATTKSQSGSEWEPEIHIPDFDDYDNCEALAVGAARAKVYICIEMQDGQLYATKEAVYIRVTKSPTANRRDGDSHWVLRFSLAGTTPIDEIAALTS